MKTDVIISIKGTQKTDAASDCVEFITEGTLDAEQNKYFISYAESEVTGLSGNTTLLIEEGRVIMTRTGDNSSHMIFEEGVRHLSHYDTGFGVFNVGVNTHSIGSTIGADGGELRVKYSIEINNEYTGMNTFFITVKGAEPTNDKFDTIS